LITINPSEVTVPQVHQYLLGAVGPRPICFASTIDAQGNSNLAPFSFFNVFSAKPPILVFAPNNSGRDGTPKHTWLNVHEVPEVVVNVVNYGMVQQMNVAAAPWDKGVSEFEKAGFTPLASDLVKPFRVAESPVQMECRVLELKELGQGASAGNLIIAEVIRMHIDEAVLNEEGKIDTRKMDLVARMGGAWYCHANSKILSANDIGKMASLLELPHEELIAGTKALHHNKNIELCAIELIAANKVAEALGLFL
jgi:flavin reductase (DIM6/NTAB) family NADH-FMN oxidoreductase RutF